MSISINVNGAIKKIKDSFINVNGEKKNIKSVFINNGDGGVNKIYSKISASFNKVIAVGNFGQIASTNDGINWNVGKKIKINSSYYFFIYNGTEYVAIGNQCDIVLFSSDKINWIPKSIIIENNTNLQAIKVIYGNNKYLMLTTNYQGLYYSEDGVNWFRSNDNITNNLYVGDIEYGANKFVWVGMNGLIYNSTDGIKWTKSTISSNSNKSFYKVTFGMDKFVAVQFSGDYNINCLISYYSTDGLIWYKGGIIPSSTFSTNCMLYSKNLFLLITYASDIFYSFNGISWNKGDAQISPNSFYNIQYDGNYFIGFDSKSIMYYSGNGINWAKNEHNNLNNGSIFSSNGLFKCNNSIMNAAINGTFYYDITKNSAQKKNIKFHTGAVKYSCIHDNNKFYFLGVSKRLFSSIDGDKINEEIYDILAISESISNFFLINNTYFLVGGNNELYCGTNFSDMRKCSLPYQFNMCQK